MIAHEELLGRVRAFVRANMPALLDARVVLAASGGADSCAMVALLCDAGIIGRRHAVVAHFDHRLRGVDASARDLAAVRALCDSYGLPFVTGDWNAPVRGEAGAREARYRFLAGVASTRGCDFVVTGHTADDQAETVLMHTLRGAGIHGLAGMATVASLPVPGVDDVRIARPLLCVTHEEARAFCEWRGIAWSEDESNIDVSYKRNHVRHELLPHLESNTPGLRVALLALSRDAHALIGTLDAAVSHLLPGTGDVAGGTVLLDRVVLRGLTRDLATHAWRTAIVRLLGDARDFGRRHFETLAAAADARTGAVLELPRGVVATVDAASVTLSLGPLVANAIPPDVERELPFAGVMGDWWIEAADARSATATNCWAPEGAVIRRRRPGDRIRLAAGGRKKLQDELIDQHVPRRERDAVPIVAAGSDVLWTPFRVAPPGFAVGLRPVAIEARRLERG